MKKTDKHYVEWAGKIVKLSNEGDHIKMTKQIDAFSKSIGNTHQVWGYLRNEFEGKPSGLQDFASIVIYYHIIKQS